MRPIRHAAVLALIAVLSIAAAAEDAAPGSAGIGDSLYPTLGNGGYDVQSYDLDLSIDPAANHLDGRVRITAVATQALASFHLDLQGLDVASVTVGGGAAGFTREGAELVVTPVAPLAEGAAFEAVVTYSGTPAAVRDPSIPIPIGWQAVKGAVYAVSEPSGAHGWFPCNDHPADKAAYAMRIRVPKPNVVAANGVLEKVDEDETTRTYTWQVRDPMATYLVTLCVDAFDEVRREGPGGLPIHDFFAPGFPEKAREPFARQGEIVAFLAERFGPYPFETAGAIVTNWPIPAALETQTRPVYGRLATDEGTIVHELAHQWFGNSVTQGDWSDIWLAEGFASYAAWLWEERSAGAEPFAAALRGRYQALVRSRAGPPANPGARGLFGAAVYLRGPWVLHALRLRLGDDRFFAALRAYTGRHRNGNARIADFVSAVETSSGEDLGTFFSAWLDEAAVPAVPELGLDPADVPQKARRPR